MLSPKDIGAKLKHLRLRKFGKNVRFFEEKSGVSRGSVPGIEEGKNWPRLDVLEKWLSACGTTFGDFFNEPNPENPYNRQFKTEHDDLEAVLESVGAEESVTVRTLRQECALLELKHRRKSRASPDEGKQPGALSRSKSG